MVDAIVEFMMSDRTATVGETAVVVVVFVTVVCFNLWLAVKLGK